MTCMGHCCGPQMIIVPVCRTMPSALLWWWRKMLLLTKWCQRQILIIYVFIYSFVFMYLFIYSCRLIQDLSSIIATDLLDLQVLLCITSHITTLGIGKLWISQLQRLILHFPVANCSKNAVILKPYIYLNS